MTADLLKRTENKTLYLTFNRPEALNAFTPKMMRALARALKSAARDDTVSCIVLEGAGRAFSAGVDLNILQDAVPYAGKVGDLYDQPAYDAALQIRRCSKPVIAKVHGACFAGALEIALHCDMVYTTKTTKFGDTHTKFGLRPSWGLSQTLPRAVGMRRARELSYTAKTFTGEEAANWGIANEACENLPELQELVSTVAAQIGKNSLEAVAAYKDLHAIAAQEGPLEDALIQEANREYKEITDTASRLAEF